MESADRLRGSHESIGATSWRTRWHRRLGAWFVCIGVSSLCIALLSASNIEADDAEFFREQVEPILALRCYACHAHQGVGGKGAVLEGGLALDWRSGWERGGDRGPAIVPGDAGQSLLMRAVNYGDEELQMPPAEKLPEAELATLRVWIERGAFDPRAIAPVPRAADWWSWRPLPDRAILPPPVGALVTRGRHPIDAFLEAQLAQVGLTPQPRADARTRVRRLMFDLHGLPPTPREVEDFSESSAVDAWPRLVDRLLASPRYGERWARHWLDTIHFADTHGYEHDAIRPHAWRYRDYVIERWNDDAPWPRLIREQLAADLFFPDEPQRMAGLGFLGAGPYDQSAAATAPKMFEHLDRDDLVTQTMAAFTSTTAQCARCHAHKFDPITQEDYYALQAVFAGVGKGDLAYDVDPAVVSLRRQVERMARAVATNDRDTLLSPEFASLVAAWEDHRGAPVEWSTLEPVAFGSTQGATLVREPDHSIVSTGTLPDSDTTWLTAPSPLRRITAIRLEVLADARHPNGGPGRAENGNFHLNQLDVQVMPHGAAHGQPIVWSHATADVEQVDWTADRTIDNQPASAWGIHPAEGQSHALILVCRQPVEVDADAQLVVTLYQTHGRRHVLGRFRLSVTNDPEPARDVISPAVRAIVAQPRAMRTVEQQETLAREVLRQIERAKRATLPPPRLVYGAYASVENERGKLTFDPPRAIHLLHRGDLEQPRTEVMPGAIGAMLELPGRFDASVARGEGWRRAALADWIAHRDHPLTWRSVVNRVWHHHFGRGICDTPNDFGRMGGTPSHPELLDWLAVWFRDDAQGSLKALHRLIVTSEAYQRVSAGHEAGQRIDPENRWLWRQNRQRLDAESFRDAILQQSDHLVSILYGPSIPQFSARPGPQVTPILDYRDFDWNSSSAARRSIYRVVWRGIPDPLLETLDFPDLGLLAPTRGFSASALQALALWNHDFILERAYQLGTQATQWPLDDSARLDRLTQRVWLRRPTDDERETLLPLARSHGWEAVCRVLWNANEFLFIE